MKRVSCFLPSHFPLSWPGSSRSSTTRLFQDVEAGSKQGMTGVDLLLRPARIGFQSRRLDAGNRNDLVIFAGIAGDPNRAEHMVASIADQHAAGIGHHPAAARGHDGSEKVRVLRGTLHHGARAPAHTQRPIGFADGNFKSDDSRTIFAFGTDEMAAAIEHYDGLRHLLEFTRLQQCGVDNARSLSERYRHSCSLLFLAAD